MTNPQPLDPARQTVILDSIRELVPNGAKNCLDRRHSLLVGVILGLKAVNHNLIPPHWFMAMVAGRTDELFVKGKE